MKTKIVWIDGVATRVPSTLEQDIDKYPLSLFFNKSPRGRPLSYLTKCRQCNWSGTEENLYYHWKENHYRKKGLSK